MVLCLSQDGACTDSFENFRDNSLKGGLSNDITLIPPLFSLVNTFKVAKRAVSLLTQYSNPFEVNMFISRFMIQLVHNILKVQEGKKHQKKETSNF